MTSPLIWCLDVASCTGWALGRPADQPRFGSLRFGEPGSSHESRFARAMEFTEKFIERAQPDVLVYEAPLPQSFSIGKSNADTQIVLTGLIGAIGGAAHRTGKLKKIWRADLGDIRRHFLGKDMRGPDGKMRKRPELKKATVEKCHALGWMVGNDNEADAAAIWSYARSCLCPEYAVAPSPLFARVPA